MPLKTTTGKHGGPARGRGATINLEGRYERWSRDAEDDGWFQEPEEGLAREKTVVTIERAKSIISRNESPDVGFTQSINPYRGCEHACSYCYARPSHAYLGLSPGLDFETRLFAKTNAAELLREELGKAGYKCTPIAIGVNTDAYQPIEREYRVTRSILEVVREAKQPVHLISKSALVERDMDLLVPMAKERLVTVTLSVTTLDNEISRRMEPRASAPARRLKAIERLSAAGIPTTVNVAPVVPFLTDSEMEAILEAAARAGAVGAGYQLMRLPWEVKDVFKAWLEANFPLKAAHVMSRVRDMREGRENDPEFGSRMRGTGLFAELLRRRFQVARERFGLDGHGMDFELDTSLFRPPSRAGQGSLF